MHRLLRPHVGLNALCFRRSITVDVYRTRIVRRTIEPTVSWSHKLTYVVLKDATGLGLGLRGSVVRLAPEIVEEKKWLEKRVLARATWDALQEHYDAAAAKVERVLAGRLAALRATRETLRGAAAGGREGAAAAADVEIPPDLLDCAVPGIITIQNAEDLAGCNFDAVCPWDLLRVLSSEQQVDLLPGDVHSLEYLPSRASPVAAGHAVLFSRKDGGDWGTPLATRGAQPDGAVVMYPAPAKLADVLGGARLLMAGASAKPAAAAASQVVFAFTFAAGRLPEKEAATEETGKEDNE